MYTIELRSIPSERFQPTGFPDLGTAKFQKPAGDGGGWVDAILVESTQSMANRFEAVSWDESHHEPVGTLAGLPWVKVIADDDERYLASSRTEAHRLASAFIKDSKTQDGNDMLSEFRDRLELSDDTPLDHPRIAASIFCLDPLCLVHGVFFADKKWPGQPKIARALTGFIEATDVKEAYSGGVKRDEVRHSISEGVGGAAEGYGSIPYSRVEYTARLISLYTSIDVRQIQSYGLSSEAAELLLTVARWEIRSFLDQGLRLRTACEFEPIDGPDLATLEEADALSSKIRSLIDNGLPELADSDGAPLVVRWSSSKKKKK